MKSNKLILIDGNSVLYREYHATAWMGVDKIMRSNDGVPTNALVGFARKMENFIAEEDYVLVAFDERGKTFRHEMYDDYKAGRNKTDDELHIQKPLVEEYLTLRGVGHHKQLGYEADDIIAHMVRLGEENGMSVEVYSSDKDLLQLVSDQTKVILIKNKGVRKTYTPENFKGEVGVEMDQFLDYKALMGDNSDNIKGVDGVGEKTAIKLLAKYGNLENIFNHIDELTPKMKEKMKEFQTRSEMVKKLVTLNDDFGCEIDIDFCETGYFEPNDVIRFFESYDIKSVKVKTDNTQGVVKKRNLSR